MFRYVVTALPKNNQVVVCYVPHPEARVKETTCLYKQEGLKIDDAQFNNGIKTYFFEKEANAVEFGDFIAGLNPETEVFIAEVKVIKTSNIPTVTTKQVSEKGILPI